MPYILNDYHISFLAEYAYKNARQEGNVHTDLAKICSNSLPEEIGLELHKENVRAYNTRYLKGVTLGYYHDRAAEKDSGLYNPFQIISAANWLDAQCHHPGYQNSRAKKILDEIIRTAAVSFKEVQKLPQEVFKSEKRFSKGQGHDAPAQNRKPNQRQSGHERGGMEY